MTHKQSLNPHANTNQPVPASDEHLQHRSSSIQKELTSAYKVTKILNALASGKKLQSSPLSLILDQIQSCASRTELTVFVKKYYPFITRNTDGVRLIIFTINERFTALGVAPAWRSFSFPDITESNEASQLDYQVMSDLRIIDLQWLHASGKGDDSVYAYSVNNDYRELMGKETFDYVKAQKIATAQNDRMISIQELGLHEDIQRELVAYRTPDIEHEIQKIISMRVEVEKDLRIAAGRNYRMGKKLIDVMPDRLDQWMSIQATQSKSKAVMYETYKKITGSKIALSSYNTKLQSLKHALRLANSKYMV